MSAFFRIVIFVLMVVPLLGAAQKDTLTVGYSNAPPFIFEENGELDGLNYRIWEKIMKRGGYEYQMVQMSFEEVLEALENGRIDAAITPLSLTSARSKKFDYSAPYYASHGAVAVSAPTAFQKIVSAFSGFLNSNFLKGILILLLIIFTFGFLGWYFEWRENTEHFREGIPGLWDGIWWSAVTLTTVGYGDKAPKTVWGKIAALLLMFGGLLFVSGITASIASSVVANEISNDMSSLDDFRGARVGTVANSQIHEYLKTHFFKDVHDYPSLEDGLNSLAKGELKGFMHDEEILRSEIQMLAFEDQLQVLPIKYDTQFYGFGIARGLDSLRQEVSLGIMEIRENADWQIILHEYGLSDFNQ